MVLVRFGKRHAAALLTARGCKTSCGALALFPFELWVASNDFNDDFTVLYAQLLLDGCVANRQSGTEKGDLVLAETLYLQAFQRFGSGTVSCENAICNTSLRTALHDVLTRSVPLSRRGASAGRLRSA